MLAELTWPDAVALCAMWAFFAFAVTRFFPRRRRDDDNEY